MPDPLDMTFRGAITLETADARFPGPFNYGITLPLAFSADRKSLDVGVFLPITVGPMGTPLGSNTITVSKKAGGRGTFDMASGAIEVRITFHFDHSLPGLLVGDSDLTFLLTTGVVTSPNRKFALTGLPLDEVTGDVTLVGAGAFTGGYLNKTDCAVTVAGTIAPSPTQPQRRTRARTRRAS